jgi:SlyX protein
MAENQDLIARLDALESHIAHQDSVIDELNEMSIKQWSEIKTLNDQMAHLKNKLQEVEHGINNPPDEEAPPPHF